MFKIRTNFEQVCFSATLLWHLELRLVQGYEVGEPDHEAAIVFASLPEMGEIELFGR